MQYGLVKTLDDGQGNKIKLVGNAMTFILYKSYFGRDLLADIIGFAKKNASEKTLENLKRLGIKDIDTITDLDDAETAELINGIDGFSFDTEFVLNFIASLIATGRYPEKPDIAEIIMSVPPHFVCNREVLTEILEFLSLFMDTKRTAAIPFH
jgi:hypothetical protein